MKLKPCPFCGREVKFEEGEAKMEEDVVYPYWVYCENYWVYCENCGASSLAKIAEKDDKTKTVKGESE